MNSHATDPLPIFALLLARNDAREGLLLVESLRAFGGAPSKACVLVYMPEAQGEIPASVRNRLLELGAEILPFEPDPHIGANLFAQRLYAASLAETRLEALGRAAREPCLPASSSILVWLDPDCFFVQEPSGLSLPDSVDFAYRPVHHKLIGSAFDSPPDEFWKRLYALSGVGSGACFPMFSTMDRRRIRPYFNAGFLALRPERAIFRSWLALFREVARDRALALLCEEDPLRLIFLHQAVLAAAVVAKLPASALLELPFSYNYPLHLHASCPESMKPSALDDLVCLRYDQWEKWPGSPSWRELLAMESDKKEWLERKIRDIEAEAARQSAATP